MSFKLTQPRVLDHFSGVSRQKQVEELKDACGLSPTFSFLYILILAHQEKRVPATHFIHINLSINNTFKSSRLVIMNSSLTCFFVFTSLINSPNNARNLTSENLFLSDIQNKGSGLYILLKEITAYI